MQNSTIEWTDHTFNLVWGCQRVSPGCEHCYAETLAHRYGFDVWGPAKTTDRRTMSANYWSQPLRWNAAAEKAGQRKRVFCCSMADVFEDHPTNEQERPKLWALIEQTPWLDWQLLTKRPENITRMVPPAWLDKPRRNVWYGTSAEDQRRFDERLPHLLTVPAQVRFLSCEPLLGPINLGLFRIGVARGLTVPFWMAINWVICGGESGAGARPMHPDWARSLRDQCKRTPTDGGTRFLFKQWGQFMPAVGLTEDGDIYAPPADNDRSIDVFGDQTYMLSLGKHAAGRLLDGREWNEMPA